MSFFYLGRAPDIDQDNIAVSDVVHGRYHVFACFFPGRKAIDVNEKVFMTPFGRQTGGFWTHGSGRATTIKDKMFVFIFVQQLRAAVTHFNEF